MRRLMHSVAMIALLALQCFVVLFVALHNWIPLGTLNNVKGVRVEFPTGKLLVTTLTNFTPFAIGLAATAFYFGRVYPGWVIWWLWITYGLACYGSFTGLVDAVSPSPGSTAGGSLPNDVRSNTCLSAGAQRHPAEYSARAL